MAAVFLVADPHRGTPDAAARLDRFASLVLAGFAALAVPTVDLIADGGGRGLFAAILVAIHLAVGLAFAPAAAATALAAAVAAATLALWPVIGEALRETPAVLPSPAGTPLPDAVSLYITFAVVAALAILATTLQRLLRGRELAIELAGAYAIAATVGPLAILVVAYWRIANFEKSLPFAAAAAALALIFVFAAGVFRKEDDQTSSAIRIGLGATASSAIAALALGLTFALDKGMLTVAFGLAALGTAWVALSVRIPVLRYVVGAIGLLILGRIAWNPIITTQGELGTTPIFNWLLWGYGVPAVSFWVAAQLLARDGRDRVTQLCESLAILFAALLAFFEIRHALNGGDPFSPATGHVESGLFASSGAGLLDRHGTPRRAAARSRLPRRVACLRGRDACWPASSVSGSRTTRSSTAMSRSRGARSSTRCSSPICCRRCSPPRSPGTRARRGRVGMSTRRPVSRSSCSSST